MRWAFGMSCIHAGIVPNSKLYNSKVHVTQLHSGQGLAYSCPKVNMPRPLSMNNLMLETGQ